MGARGAFYILSIEKYTAFVSAPDRAAFLDEFERLNHGETAGLFGEDGVGLMDKAWWGLFCILPPGVIDSVFVQVGGHGSALLLLHRVRCVVCGFGFRGKVQGRFGIDDIGNVDDQVQPLLFGQFLDHLLHLGADATENVVPLVLYVGLEVLGVALQVSLRTLPFELQVLLRLRR